jgi:hypothetical protein
MPKSMYIIAPAADVPTYYGAEVFSSRTFA